MDYSKEDKAIELALNHLNTITGYMNISEYVRNELGKEYAPQSFVDRLLEYDVIQLAGGRRGSHMISITGQNIVRNGGWLKHLERQIDEVKKDDDRQEKQDKKLDNEVKLSKLQVDLYWVFVGIALIGAVTGIIALFK